MIDTTATQMFDKDLPAALAAKPDRAKAIGGIYGFVITGDGGGRWLLDVPSLTCLRMVSPTMTTQCTLELSHEDFKSIAKNPTLGMQFYFQGKLKVTGDPLLATKLQRIFGLL